MLRRIIRAVGLTAAILMVSGRCGYAQQIAVDEVKAAVEAYHIALVSLDVTKMAPLWAHEDDVMLINPRDKEVVIGWDAVQKDWETTFAPEAELKVTQTSGPYIRVVGDTAWATGIVNSEIKLKSGQAITALTFQTDVFEKRNGKWLIVAHVASRVPQ
jgi:ketosteroid isomerase-like protein